MPLYLDGRLQALIDGIPADLDGIGSGDSLQFNGTELIPVPLGGGLQFQAAWNANTNSPDLTAITPTVGYFWVVSVGGATALTGAPGPWTVGDFAISQGGGNWVQSNQAPGVQSFEGRDGVVTSANGDYNAGEVTFTPDGNIAAVNVQAAIVEVRDDAATATGDVASDLTTHEGVAATEGVSGHAELATQAEANTGTDDIRIVTPLKLKTLLDSSLTTTKGDILARTSTAIVRVGVGSNGQLLVADSAETAGVKWASGNLLQPPKSAYLATNESLNSTTFTDLAGMSVSITTTVASSVLMIDVTYSGYINTNNRVARVKCLVDGVDVGTTSCLGSNANLEGGTAFSKRVTVSNGVHTVKLQWANHLSGTIYCQPVANPDYDHCSLIVSEVAT